MAATTPYQQNDYQAVSNYRPYELPINDIFKALSAQNQFWEDGARRVKSVHDNALNLKLSLEPNKEIRKRFMEEAEKQLTKLSSMDLSDPSVQKQGFDIFKPLFQDEGVMSDDQATRWIENVQSDIMRSKEMENGKGYADSNAMVAMEGVYEFKTAKDRMAGKSYLQNKRSYTPYYDSSKEMSDLLKNCKGPTISSTMPGAQGEMYLHTQEVSGASPARVQSCLNAGLSQRAKDQIGIDGYASYMSNNRLDHPEGKNYQALRDDYMAGFGASLASVEQDIADMDGKITAFQNAYNNTKNPAYLEMKKQAEAAKNNYTDQAKNLSETATQLSSGNLDFIKKNYGSLAEQLHTRKQLGLFGEAFRNDKTEDKYSADAVRLQQQRLVYDEAKQKAQFGHDKEMAEVNFGYDLQLEMLKGSVKGKKLDANGNVMEDLVPTNPAYTDADKVSTGYKEFQSEVSTTQSQIDAVNKEFFNTLKRKYPSDMERYATAEDFFKPGPNGVSAAVSFLDTHGRIAEDENVQNWSNQSALLTTKLDMLNKYSDANELEISSRENKLNTNRNITLGNMQFSEKDIADAMGGVSTNPLTTRKIEKNVRQDLGDGKSIMTKYDVTEFLYNGKVIASQDSGLNWDTIRGVILKVGDASNKNAKIRNEIYGRSMLTLRPDVYADVNNTDKDDPTRNRILAAIPGQFDIKDIQIIKKDPTTGWAEVSIKGNDKLNVTSDEIKKRFAAIAPADESKFDEGKNEAIIRIQSPSLIDRRTLNNPMTMLQLNLEKLSQVVNNPKSPYSSKEVGQLIQSLDISTGAYKGSDFRIDIIKTMGGVKYEVQSKQKNNVTSADGTIIQEKGKYYSTGQSFSNTNQLLEYLNGTKQNSSR